MSLHDPMDNETLANELARQGALLQEAVLRLEHLTVQADQRSKVAEEKTIAAVTAISMVKITDQNRDADKFWLETYSADRVDKKTFAEFLGEVETCLSVLARPLLEWAAAFRDQPIVMSDVEVYEAAHGNPFDWNLKEVRRLDPCCAKCAKAAQESSSNQCRNSMSSMLGGCLRSGSRPNPRMIPCGCSP